MRNFILIARHEFRRVILRRGFLFGTLAVPLGIVALVALVVLIAGRQQSDLPLGYVDQTGLLDPSQRDQFPGVVDEAAVFIAYPDQASALAALEDQTVQAVFVLPPDFLETQASDLFFLEDPPGHDIWVEFDNFVRVSLVASLPPDVATRLLSGPAVTVKEIDSSREFSQEGILNIVVPFVASFFFVFAVMSASGYMLHAVTDEKENRTMELMLTSVSSGQMIGGKTAGLLAVTLTQLSIWILAVGFGLMVAAPYVEVIRSFEIPWTYLGVMLLFFLPAYGFIAALTVAIGAAVNEVQQGQQISGMLSLVIMAPIFLLVLLFSNPSHPIFIFMTFFPPTAFMTVSLRWGLAAIPVWQLGLSWILLVAGMGLMVWIASRLFRAGMLRYGQPLSLKGALAALRSA